MDSLPSIAFRILRDVAELSDETTIRKLIARNIEQAEYFENQSSESACEDSAVQHQDAAKVLQKFLDKNIRKSAKLS